MGAVHLHMPLLMVAAARSFEVDVLVFGALLVVGALASGIVRHSLLSLTALFVLVGFALGDGGLGVVHFGARSAFTGELATIALIVILLRDGLEVEGEMLQAHWHLPLRKLVLAMPLTAAIVAGAARLLTDFSWTECLLLGALLSPTDPVLSSSVVTNPRVPRIVRHSLNLESGLNDGLALPAVLAFAAALGPGAAHFNWWRFVAQDLGVGLVSGLVVGMLAARLMPRPHEDDERPGIPSHQISLYALGAAFASYGIAVLPPHGNGLIAVFVAAITLGIRRPDARGHFERQAENLVEIVKLGIFVVFGSLLTLHGLLGDGWGAVGIVAATLLVARPVAVFAALSGTAIDRATKGFMGWFGPKGVATMTFSLLVLADRIPAASRIFNLAALVVFCSIIAHGVTDTAGSEWLARRSERATDSPADLGEDLAAE
ncbi:MAG: cation:proton antiporter [Solirubrobacteraceae bacterium]